MCKKKKKSLYTLTWFNFNDKYAVYLLMQVPGGAYYLFMSSLFCFAKDTACFAFSVRQSWLFCRLNNEILFLEFERNLVGKPCEFIFRAALSVYDFTRLSTRPKLWTAGWNLHSLNFCFVTQSVFCSSLVVPTHWKCHVSDECIQQNFYFMNWYPRRILGEVLKNIFWITYFELYSRWQIGSSNEIKLSCKELFHILATVHIRRTTTKRFFVWYRQKKVKSLKSSKWSRRVQKLLTERQK